MDAFALAPPDDEERGFHPLKSHTAQTPSSAPVVSKCGVSADQLRILTSVSLTCTLIAAFRALDRVSQIFTVPSLLAEAKTVRSLGDQARSSTLPECPVKGRVSVVHFVVPTLEELLGSRVWRNILPSLSPLRSLGVGVRGDQARA